MKTKHKPPETHAYHPDSVLRDGRGGRLCQCGLPKHNARHQLPANPAADLEARRLGEHHPAG